MLTSLTVTVLETKYKLTNLRKELNVQHRRSTPMHIATLVQTVSTEITF